jgi:carbon monoxide dehydrogenase subunit G
MRHVDATRHIAAPADEVWALLADQTRWPDWSGFDSVDVVRSSPRAAMRLIKSGEAGVRELIRSDAIARRFAYRHLEGLPVRYYAGDVTLTPNPDGTTVVWRAQIEPLYFGAEAIVDVLRRVIQEAIVGLAETAETEWRESGFSAHCTTARR